MGQLFGDCLKKFRKEAGLTQTQLSEKLNVHLQTVSKWERNVSEPDFSVLGELADVLHITLEKLLGVPEGEEVFRGNFDAVLFGKAISFARKGKGESQESLAERIGVSADTVSKWERGVICPNIEQLKILSKNLEVPVSKLYFGITEEETQTVRQVQRRKRFSWVSLFAAVLFCAGVVFLSVYFSVFETDEKKIFYTVSVDGQVYEVEKDGWFSPAVPQRVGYDFIGFEDADHVMVQFPQKITGDIAYTAVFEPHEYKIEYWLNGGWFNDDAVSSFTVESGTIELFEPIKNGAVFEGWFLTADYSGTEVSRISCNYEDVVLYARWSDNIFTVRYDLCGGVLSEPNPETVTIAREETLFEPVRKGYDFLGWFDAPSGGELYLTVGGSKAKNLVLYAHWQKSNNMYSIRYELNGGTLSQNNPVIVGAGEVHELYSPEKFGYDFIGWNTSESGDGEYYDRLYGIREELTLYAIYSPKTYIMQYDLDGGTYYEGVNPNTITYEETVELLPLAKYGYDFAGWYDAKTGGKKVDKIDKSNVAELTILYACFVPKTYEVELNAGEGTFQLNGAVYKQYSLTLQFGEIFVLPECVLAGYEFIGWVNEAGEVVENIDELNIEDISLTARYRVAGQTYNITYELDGGEQNPENAEVIAFGQEIPLKEPIKEGYSFLGWNDQPDGTGNYYDRTQKEWESDKTLYAIWQEITVSGSSDDFLYEKGVTYAVLTGYKGKVGEDVDIVLPSFIDGVPVRSVADNFSSRLSANSLTIPDTYVSLGNSAFQYLDLNEPLVISQNIETIGEKCFFYSELAIIFTENGKLKEISEYAFHGAKFKNIVVLPEGIERLLPYTFYNIEAEGIILPESLRIVDSNAVYIHAESKGLAKIYIPDTIEYISKEAITGIEGLTDQMKPGALFIIYTTFTYDELLTFPDIWDNEYFIFCTKTGGVTLKSEDRVWEIEGNAFALPKEEKQGSTFIGWRIQGEDEFVGGFFVPEREGMVLEAVFETNHPYDGRSIETKAVLDGNSTYEFLIPANGIFYFEVDLPEACSCYFDFRYTIYKEDMGDSKLQLVIDYNGTVIQAGELFEYKVPTDFKIVQTIPSQYVYKCNLQIKVIS